MSQYVVWFDSSETGAPVLNNAAGSLIGVLDACLITGFNTKTVTIAVLAGVATATANGHGFSGVYGKDVLIAGATPALLNGRKELTFVDTNTFRFAAPGVADGAATGTITAKRDPLGWVKQFSGTNKAIYKRSDVTATSMMLRVDDTNAGVATATDARARMIESATDIDTLTGLAPTDTQQSGGQYWNKGPNTATAKPWRIVGNGKNFYLFTATSSATGHAAASFGDFVSFKSGDAYNCLITSGGGAWNGGSAQTSLLGYSNGFAAPASPNAYLSRAFNQSGASVQACLAGFTLSRSGDASASLPNYPSPMDSGLLINPQMLLVENDAIYSYPARGTQPGLCQILAKAPFADLQIVEPVVSLPGRKLLVLILVGGNSAYQIAVDITGPWA